MYKMAQMTTGNSTEFVLNEFNQAVALGVSGEFDAGTETIAAYDAVCEVEISKSKWSSCFKITSDSVDISDAEATDITYFVYNQNDVAGMKGTSAMNNKASLANGPSLMDANPAVSVASDVAVDPTATNNEVEYDFIRHVAEDLFNTHHGVDLFKNEVALRLSVETACGAGADNLLNKLEDTMAAAAADYSAGSKVKVSAGAANKNLTYILLKQLFSKQPTRFSNYAVSDSTPTELPWAAGDKICYVLTINAAPNQHELVRASTAVAARKYLVKMILKE
jgi:hypothetical protein